MQYLFKLLFYILGVILVLFLFKIRTERFSFIKENSIMDYPIRRYRIGSLILIIWILVILFGIFQEIVLKQAIDSKIFLGPVLLSIFYSLFGATPTVTKSKHKINLTLDFANVGSLGLDFLGSWVGHYDKGIIIYFYRIDFDSINIKKLSKDEIIFSGLEKHESIPINVSLKSKKSINYIYPLLDNINLKG